MSGSHDEELSPEDLAGIAEYENSEEGRAAGKPAPEGGPPGSRNYLTVSRKWPNMP